jgi:hypothetical protein
MNRKSIAAAILALASTTGFAAEAEMDQFEAPRTGSSLTRQDVQNELQLLKESGAWEPQFEASPSLAQTQEWDRRIAQMQGADTSVATVSRDELIAMAERSGYDVIIVEPGALQPGDLQSDELQPGDGSLPFEHPAVEPR